MVHSLVGKPAPTVSGPDSNGETYNFTPGSGGAAAVLFFYPKSGRSPCRRYGVLPVGMTLVLA
jgi:thioredoxin-dependent peroxiredoxin